MAGFQNTTVGVLGGSPSRASALDRFMAKVNQAGPNGCWLWTGSISPQGYGMFCLHGRAAVGAHRLALWFFRGIALRPGRAMNVDHLCRVRHCVNPEHLEYVTHRENQRRGAAATKTHCVRGHAFDASNTRWEQNHRRCRACHAADEQRRRALGIASPDRRGERNHHRGRP